MALCGIYQMKIQANFILINNNLQRLINIIHLTKTDAQTHHGRARSREL